MTGIAAYGAFVPQKRLPLSLIAGRPAREGGPEKAIADYDEDAVTMAVAAALDCLSGGPSRESGGANERSLVDGLFFASTTYPLREKQGAALIAKALDLPRSVRTQDFASSLRAGTGALEAALDAVRAGSLRRVLVVASDCRMGAPRGALEAKLGDGAAAFLVASEGAIATPLGSWAVANELQDFWRGSDERYTHGWEDRFAIQEGYTPNTVEAVEGLFAKVGLGAGDFARAALYGPDARSLGGVAKQLGIAAERLQDPFFGRLGNTGAAFAPMLLAAALEDAKAGEKILVASYGDGAHALAFEVSDAIEKLEPRVGVSGHLARRRALGSYDTYLKARNLQPQEWEAGADLGLSATVRYRERDADIAMMGARCSACSELHFPEPRVCYRCHAKDQWEPFRLSDQQGTVLSYTFDFFFPASEPPTIVVMTEVLGCRVQVQLADTRPEEVRLDMQVRFAFRKIHEAGGKANYFWKALPIQSDEGDAR